MNPFAYPSGRLTGDTFPIFRDGICHLFHMMMPGIAHHVSHDMVHWEERSMVVMPGKPGDPDSSNIATGCVVEHERRFYLFYTGNQNICLAVSDDLENWTKHPGNPVVCGDNQLYGTLNFRDAFVYYSNQEGCWHMLFGTQTVEVPAQRAGCVGLAKSSDLLHWKLAPPLWSPHIGPHTDCPQLSEHDGRWYLFYLQRNTRYRVADSPSGPFTRPPIRNLGTVLAAGSIRHLSRDWKAKMITAAGSMAAPLPFPGNLIFTPMARSPNARSTRCSRQSRRLSNRPMPFPARPRTSVHAFWPVNGPPPIRVRKANIPMAA